MGAQLSGPPPSDLDGVTAVVLTHMRPRLAGQTVRVLIDDEGFSPSQVVVVVNGEGGLDDPDLERSVRMVRMAENLGPAGGFRRALIEAFAESSTQWAYVCEDDMALLHLPTPRVGALLERVAAAGAQASPSGKVGAVVPFGRVFVARSGHTNNVVPRRGLPGELAPVDVSTWGATLVSRAVIDAGVLPDPELFFGFEDFDFFCQIREAGFSVLVDVLCARHIAHRQTSVARDESLRGHRPIDSEEPWRAYYFARNFFALARRQGHRSWLAFHLLYSLRRLQLAHSTTERVAIVRGLFDGARAVLGVNPRYRRTVGERQAQPEAEIVPIVALSPKATKAPPTPPTVAPDGAAQVVALVLSHNAPMALARCIEAIAGQTQPPQAIIVVDNASTPPVTVGAQCGPGAPTVSVVRSETNLGPAGGWALAFEAFLTTPFDFAWVLDDDMLPDPDCLQVLVGQTHDDPQGAFLFPWSVQPDGSVGAWGSWCGFVVAKHIVELVGVPMAELFWWAEDNEYCLWRIPQAGFKRRIVDGAVVQHDAIRQGGGTPTWKYYYEARNMLFLHLHVMHRVGWYPRNVTKLVARAALRERGHRLVSLAAISRGLVDGARGRLGVTVAVAPMREHALSDDGSASPHPGASEVRSA